MPRMKAKLGEDFPEKESIYKIHPGNMGMDSDGPMVVSAGFNKSNAVSSITRGNCLIVLPSDSEGFRKGMEVDVLLLGQELGVQHGIC